VAAGVTHQAGEVHQEAVGGNALAD
jgi:hypothetical protein